MKLSRFLSFWACCCLILSATTDAAQRVDLTADQLLSPTAVISPVHLAAFAMPEKATKADHYFQGRLVISPDQQRSFFSILRDDYGLADRQARKTEQLPTIDINLIQSGHHLIPQQRQPTITDHPHWETIVGPGRVWQEPSDQGYSRASLPFSLRERNANCTHNGVINFLYKDDGSVSNLFYQISSETCLYFKFNWAGIAQGDYQPGPIDHGNELIRAYQEEVASRLPVKPMAQITESYAEVNIGDFGGRDIIPAGDMTLYGFVIDGINYIGGCQTRHGPYPFCEVLDLPSYSLAKTLFAGLGLMYLETNYPGAKQQWIADYVPACKKAGQWQDVSFEHALNMATGNYQSKVDRKDEWSQAMEDHFFIPETHAEKIDYACHSMLRQSKPGSEWVYHTTDTYILGTAINQFIKGKKDNSADSFRDIFQTLWQDVKLSPLSQTTLRSYDSRQQPFTGFGLTLHHNDIALMAAALVEQNSPVYQRVDQSMLDAAMQRLPADRGLDASTTGYKYKHGFWAKNFDDLPGCAEEVWLPFMTGYGGINVVLMPNNTAYYYFSDSGQFTWRYAAMASHGIRPFCESKTGLIDRN